MGVYNPELTMLKKKKKMSKTFGTMLLYFTT